MKGQRLPDDPQGAFRPGDYGRLGGKWHMRPPQGQVVTLEDEWVSEHPDGTITAVPDILAVDEAESGRSGVVLWLGTLERGEWKEIQRL